MQKNLRINVRGSFLFKTVPLKGLKAVDVQDSDELVDLAGGVERLIDLANYPIEEVRVDALGQGLFRLGGLCDSHGLGDGLVSGNNLGMLHKL